MRPVARPCLHYHLDAWRTHVTLGRQTGHIHAWSDTDALNPVFVGSGIRLEGKIVDKFIKRGRGYFRMECRAVDQDGRELCRETRESAYSYEKIADE